MERTGISSRAGGRLIGEEDDGFLMGRRVLP